MPWQGHLWIGEKPKSLEDVADIWKRLGQDVNLNQEPEDISVALEYIHIDTEITVDGIEMPVTISFATEWERLGSMGEILKREMDMLVGFKLTSRYRGSILDKGDKGRPEPFEVDIAKTKDILEQIRTKMNWPEANVYMWTQWH